jgi:hypothetical protein
MFAAWWARIFIQLAPRTQLSGTNSQHINRIASQRQSSNNPNPSDHDHHWREHQQRADMCRSRLTGYSYALSIQFGTSIFAGKSMRSGKSFWFDRMLAIDRSLTCQNRDASNAGGEQFRHTKPCDTTGPSPSWSENNLCPCDL